MRSRIGTLRGMKATHQSAVDRPYGDPVALELMEMNRVLLCSAWKRQDRS